MNKCGWLRKRGDVLQTWNLRYVEVDPVSHALKYYKDLPDGSGTQPRGYFSLVGCTIKPQKVSESHRFEIIDQHEKTYFLEASSDVEMHEWIRCLKLNSTLGSMTDRVNAHPEEIKDQANENGNAALGVAADQLLGDIAQRTDISRDRLMAITDAKWKAKCNLNDKYEQIQQRKADLEERYEGLGQEEENQREIVYKLNSKIYTLEQYVQRSRKIQAEIVAKFRSGAPYQDSANELVKYYESRPASSSLHVGDRMSISISKSDPKKESGDMTTKANGVGSDDWDQKQTEMKSACVCTADNPPANGCCDPSCATSVLCCCKNCPKSRLEPVEESVVRLLNEWLPNPNDTNQPMVASLSLSVMLFYTDFHENVHLPKEVELNKLKSDRQAIWSTSRRVTSQRQMVKDEIKELDYICDEIQKALNSKSIDSFSNVPTQTLNLHKRTWNEAANAIGWLRQKRLEQDKISKELEATLESRETLSSWQVESGAIGSPRNSMVPPDSLKEEFDGIPAEPQL